MGWHSNAHHPLGSGEAPKKVGRDGQEEHKKRPWRLPWPRPHSKGSGPGTCHDLQVRHSRGSAWLVAHTQPIGESGHYPEPLEGRTLVKGPYVKARRSRYKAESVVSFLNVIINPSYLRQGDSTTLGRLKQEDLTRKKEKDLNVSTKCLKQG